MKKYLSLALVLIFLLSAFASCASIDDLTDKESATDTETSENTSPDDTGSGNNNNNNNNNNNDNNDPPTLTGTSYPLNNTADWVKLLDPRMEATASHITCDWSASGIEFTAVCKGDVVFSVNASTKTGAGVNGCYFRAYVDGEEYLNGDSPYYAVNGEGYITLKALPEGAHTIKLVKATGYTLANVDLKSVTLDGTVGETAPANKELFIEFVGDSISCGWGVVGSYDGAYTAQDATLAYPYMVAEKLGADYSVVALSGQGIIKGNPGIANGYKFASPFRSKNAEYGFDRKADVVVINADTNDAYDRYPEEMYKTALSEFISYVREKNGEETHILLVCNVMKDNYVNTIKGLVDELGGAESGYYYYKAPRAAGVHTSHPTAEENVIYAAAIGDMIEKILNGTYDEDAPVIDPDAVTIPDGLKTVYTQNFDSATTAAEAGVTNLYGGKMALAVQNGALSIPATAWGDGVFATLIENAAFADYASKYLVEMDVTVNSLGVLGFILNTSGAKTEWNSDKKSSHLITLRRGTYNTGNIDADSNIKFRAGYFTADGSQTTPSSNDVLAYDVADGASSASFKLSILVDGNRIDLFIDGIWVHGYDVPEAVDCSLKANSALILWAQDASATIDNLTLKIDESTSGSVDAEEGVKIPENSTVIYEQNFNSAATPSDAGVNGVYGGMMDMTVSDGKLNIGKTGWDVDSNGAVDCFTTLVGNEVLKNITADKYIIEMDLTLSELHVFGFILNGDNDSESHSTNADRVTDIQNGILITLRGSKDPSSTEFAANKISAENDIYFRTGYFNATGGQTASNKVSAYDCTGDTASFKLTMVINGGNVDLFIDGVYVYTYTAPASIDGSLKENSSVMIWAEKSQVTVDNIKVSVFN